MIFLSKTLASLREIAKQERINLNLHELKVVLDTLLSLGKEEF